MRTSRRRGTPSRRAIAIAASGSVGERMAPSANAAAHGSPATTVWAATATADIVTSTRPMALIAIGRALLRRSRVEAVNAAL